MSPQLRVADVHGNVEQILQWTLKAESQQADVVLFPELSITGYTLGDVVRWPDLLVHASEGLVRIAEWSRHHSPLIIVGLPLAVQTHLFNCAAAIHNGTIHGLVPKTYLPSKHEFFDHRWFTSGRHATHSHVSINNTTVPFGTDLIFDLGDNCRIGIEICEDLWAVEPPSGGLSQAGATIIANPSASNAIVGKRAYRSSLVQSQAARCYVAYAYASSGPGESTADTVFSGHCIINECGEPLSESEQLRLQGAWAIADVDLERIAAERMRSSTFNQHVQGGDHRHVRIQHSRLPTETLLRPLTSKPFVPENNEHRAERCAEILSIQATALAMRMQRVGARKLVLGLSGGLDSTWALIVCTEACAALGIAPSAVLAVTMPGMGTSEASLRHATELATKVGAEFRNIPIAASVLQHFMDIGHDKDNHNVVYENAQARERTQILMDVANTVNGIVVGTGDLSELALGWNTYNGDHMSMYGVNSGVPKTLVQSLVSWYATQRATPDLRVVLESVLAAPISPELLPLKADGTLEQQTEDILGPYEVHDFFLYHMVRQERSVRSTAALAILAFEGRYSPEQLYAWFELFITRFWSSQFKRNAMPDGVKVGSVSLSPRTDLRMPTDGSCEVYLSEFNRTRAILR